tara:strand:- start:5076 stop:5846 length:771 start_codon:yes stop_codon:yes gene_type:complete
MTKRMITECPEWVSALKEREFSGAQKSSEWLTQRSKMLTASDAGAAIGENKYQTQSDFIHTKCNESFGEKTYKGNANTEWGEAWEQTALQKYCDRYHKDVYSFNLIQHKSIPWMGGSPDGITHDKILIEIKCPPQRKPVRGDASKIPVAYMHQVQMLLHICELEICHFVQYVPYKGPFADEYFDVIEIKLDPDWWSTKQSILADTWAKILSRRHLIETGDFLPELVEDTDDIKPKRQKNTPEPSKVQQMDFLITVV